MSVKSLKLAKLLTVSTVQDNDPVIITKGLRKAIWTLVEGSQNVSLPGLIDTAAQQFVSDADLPELGDTDLQIIRRAFGRTYWKGDTAVSQFLSTGTVVKFTLNEDVVDWQTFLNRMRPIVSKRATK